MFEHARKGERVWSSVDGYGVIVGIVGGYYPICVEFDRGVSNSFTKEGKRFISDLNPTLFWHEIKFDIQKKPHTSLSPDTKVLVWDDGENKKHKRYFKRFSGDNIICFPYGVTSWTCDTDDEVKWDYWELAEENKDSRQ